MLNTTLSVYQSARLSVSVCLCMAISVYFWLCICLSVSLSLSKCLLVCLSARLSICFVCFSQDKSRRQSINKYFSLPVSGSVCLSLIHSRSSLDKSRSAPCSANSNLIDLIPPTDSNSKARRSPIIIIVPLSLI